MRSFLFCLFLCFAVPAWTLTESVVSRQVEKAPEIKSFSDLKKLVHSLVKNSDSDEKKAYTILTWLVKNIDYDSYKYSKIIEIARSHYTRSKVPQSSDIVKTRLGVCEDIANLYKDMLEEVGVQAKVIQGCTTPIEKWKENCSASDSAHAWNAVWIDKQWEFVDPTWSITGGKVTAMDDVSRQSQYDRELRKRQRSTSKVYEPRKNRRVDKKWFMTAPETMQKDHYPFDEKWSLLKARDRKNKNL